VDGQPAKVERDAGTLEPVLLDRVREPDQHRADPEHRPPAVRGDQSAALVGDGREPDEPRGGEPADDPRDDEDGCVPAGRRDRVRGGEHHVTGSSQNAFQVAGPILRSTLRPFDFWNWPTTFSVTSPNRPSAPPAVLSSFQPRSMSRCCARARPLDHQRPATLTTSFGTFVFRVLPEILVRGPDCGP